MPHLQRTVVVMLCLATVPTIAQDTVNGTWQVESTAAAPSWSVFLRVDGDSVTGVVSRCASAQARPTDISDGRLDGKSLTFKCTSGDRDRTVTFAGTVEGDTITFRWERRLRPGGFDNGAVDRMFGPSAARQFTVKRVADGALAKAADDVRGSEFAAAVNVTSKDAKAEAVLFVPDSVKKVRTAIVPIDYGHGHAVYDAPEWRQLAATIDAALVRVRFSSIGSPRGGLGTVNFAQDGGDLLFSVLRRLSEDSGHPDLAASPLILWGHSGGGGVASILTGAHPERVLAFIRYHSGPVGGDLRTISTVPSLLISGGQDTTAPAPVAEGLWKSGRAMGAPWAFAIHADAVHGDTKDLGPAHRLMASWTAAVVRHRLPSGSTTLQNVRESSGWLGDNRTGVIGSHESFMGEKTAASWLPDEATARAWRELHAVAK